MRRLLTIAGTILPILLVVALAMTQGDSPAPEAAPTPAEVSEASNIDELLAQEGAERMAAADEQDWQRGGDDARGSEEPGIDVCTGRPLEPGAPTRLVTDERSQCPRRSVSDRRDTARPETTRRTRRTRSGLTAAEWRRANEYSIAVARYCLSMSELGDGGKGPNSVEIRSMVAAVYGLIDLLRKDPDTYRVVPGSAVRKTMRQLVGEARDTAADHACNRSSASRLDTALETLPR